MEEGSLFFPLNVLNLGAQQQEHLLEILHDDIIQIGCQIERSLRDLTQSMPDSSPLHETIDETTVLTTTLLDRLRSIVTGLYILPENNEDLFASLRSLLQDIEKRTGVHCLLITDPFQCPVERDLQRKLYSIVRELVHNTVIHARAEWIRVTICREESTLYVRVQDNGCGFVCQPINRLCEQGHFGLYLLGQRVSQLGGKVHLRSTPAQGTIVTIRIPWGLHEIKADLFVPMD